MDSAAGIAPPGRLDLLSSDTSGDKPGAEARPGGARSLLARAGWVLATVAALAVVVPVVLVYNQRADLLSDLERRLDILARGRAEVIDTWLDGLTRPVDKVVNSEMFRLFATEVDLSLADMADLAAGAGEIGVPLAAQIPFMSQVLTDFAKSEGFASAHLINRRGVAYVSSAGAPEVGAGQRAIAARTLKGGVLRYGPIRVAPGGLTLDIFAPVRSAQSGSERGDPVGVALLSVPVAGRLNQHLATPPLAEPGEQLRLLQFVAGEAYEIAPREVPALRPARGFQAGNAGAGDAEPDRAGPVIAFARRNSVAGGSVYSVGAPVSGPAWWVVQEIDAKAVTQRLGGFVAAVATVAVLIVLAVAAVFGAFWWRLANEHNSALAGQYRSFAARMEAQKRLLDSINNTITDHIGLKSLDGSYRYLNPAFARMIGKDVEQAIGLDDAAIYGRGTAARLKHSDQRALASGTAVTVNEEVYIGAKPRHLQITKIPHRDDTGVFSGIVTVTRDVSDLVEEQRKREQAVRQTVAALVRAVELRDPYLAGHSRRVAGFAVAVAHLLGASPEETATVEIAADLSQIGKLGVPREILSKPGRLNPAEIKQMEGHLDHAAAILRDIDFDLPVLETVLAMHERLDGKGYPAGLSGGQISRAARILGACDVFCARLEPRSYRRGIATEAAMEILEENPERYDAEVVAALREAVQSVAGEKLLADLGAA